ncbi:MAG: hypothetical protein ACRC62_36355 [Microcoleus sp.]
MTDRNRSPDIVARTNTQKVLSVGLILLKIYPFSDRSRSIEPQDGFDRIYEE